MNPRPICPGCEKEHSGYCYACESKDQAERTQGADPGQPAAGLDLAADDMEIALQTAAQAWCTKENSGKVMDSDLAQAFARSLAGWIGTARQYSRNQDYYMGLLDKCAEHLGPGVYVQDDGGISDSVLRAKIPELVAALATHPGSASTGPTEANHG